jgi:hypothetical protein
MAIAHFHPQAWQNDYAIDVDPEGDTSWDVGEVPADLEDDNYESDQLRFHKNAPQWVQDWSGPFWVEIVR